MKSAAVRTVLVLTLRALYACAPNPAAGTDASSPAADAATGTDAPAATDVPPVDVRVPDATEGAPVLVYAHSRDTLYQFDPRARRLSTVGTFDCITPTGNTSDSADGVTDLAIDREGRMYAVGRVSGGSALVTVDSATARCARVGVVTHEGTGLEIQGLSFVPAGTFEPANESLMGIGSGGGYFRIDRSTAAATRVATLGDGSIDTRGGDFVSIVGGATYTINNDGGSIYTFDPATGAVRTTVMGQGGLADGWGMGYWGGTLYGFTFLGRIFAIDPRTGVGTEVPITNPPAGLSFRGAAVTTVAPIVAPG